MTTAATTSDPTPTTAKSGTGSERYAMIVVGVVLVLIALVPLGAGGILVGTHATQRDGDGFYASASNPISTPTRALVSDDLDIGIDGPDRLLDEGRLGTLRLTATGTESSPVFVGIARTSDVSAYLGAVERDEILDLELDPFSVSTTRHVGTAVPAPPASQRFWAESSIGSGEQAIEWPVEEGHWSAVVMNADGTPGVATGVSVGARLGFVLWLGVVGLVAGAVILFAGIALIVSGNRGSRSGAPAGAPVPSLRVAEGTW